MTEPRALVLQTQDSAPPGLLSGWADARGIRLDVVRVEQEPRFPDPGDYTFAVALGSSGSLAEARPAWMTSELDWLREADRAGLPVLGICFGAQALAVAHGGEVFRLHPPEVAWLELDIAGDFPIPSGPWLTWHEDAITLPPAAHELARTPASVQAFTLGRHVGVQFHPEVTPAIVSAWTGELDRVLANAGIDGARIEAEARERAPAATAAAHRLFDSFAAHAGVVLDGPTLVGT